MVFGIMLLPAVYQKNFDVLNNPVRMLLAYFVIISIPIAYNIVRMIRSYKIQEMSRIYGYAIVSALLFVLTFF
jgi:hypothetical protein